jgi:TldD protein
MNRAACRLIAASCVVLASAATWTRAADPARDSIVLRAMHDELERSRNLKIVSLDTPYFIQYTLEDGDNFMATATLGGLVSAERIRFRIPGVQVRVGDYKFDNSNFIGTGQLYGGRYDVDRMPLDDDYGLLRRFLWLHTDQQYKGAVQAIARKRALLKNLNVNVELNDFARAAPVRAILPASLPPLDEETWKDRLRKLSALLAGPDLRTSSIEFHILRSVRHLTNTEGTELRVPSTLAFLRARASGTAQDGMAVRDATVIHALDISRMPGEEELARAMRSLAGRVSDLARAPVGEQYVGPVLFEGQAAAQLFAEILGRNLALPRRPVMEASRGGYFAGSELEGRGGSRVLPEWMDVVDDPTQTEYRGRPLFGHFLFDQEGLAPQPLVLVEKGVLKNFLLTRQPVKGYEGSNGRARMPGNFGASTASFGNMFVRASETVSAAALKKRLIELCQSRGKPYGILIRKMDFPSSASLDEARRIFTAAAQGGSRATSPPILVYRVFPDGREELVRGLRFAGLSARSLKDILAASDESHLFEFLESPAPFALMGATGFVSETAVIAPSVLIDDLELQKASEETPKPPVVPAP